MAASNQTSTSNISKRREARREKAGDVDRRLIEILDAAERVFSVNGYDQASLEDVASAAGIHRSSLYYYFGSKAELLAAVLERPIKKLRIEVKQITVGEMTPAQRLNAAIEAHLKHSVTNPLGMELWFAQKDVAQLGEFGDPVKREILEYRRMIQAIIVDGQSSGDFSEDMDPYFATMGVVGMLTWAHRWYKPTKNPQKDIDAVCRNFQAMVMSGLHN